MINKSWDDFLQHEFNEPYFQQLSQFLKSEYAIKKIYPSKQEVFSSFYYTDLDKVKVVILGQDPYHQPGQACGLAFAVKPHVNLPPSLQNIYKEISDDLHISMSDNGYLVKWSQQGVLLLNTVLTVEEGKPNSHKGKGWETFTDHTISYLDKQDKPMVFLLWGANAKNKETLLTNKKHLILKSVHPSPLSAYHGFFGCKHFSQANAYLKANGLTEIDWKM